MFHYKENRIVCCDLLQVWFLRDMDTNSDLTDNATVWQLLQVLLLRQNTLSFVFPVVALHEHEMTYVLTL